MTNTTKFKTNRIRYLNDAFRRTFIGAAVMITQGVEAMPLDQRRSLLEKGASMRSRKGTIRIKSTTSAQSTKLANGSSERSTTMTKRPSSAHPIPPILQLRFVL